MWKPCGDTLIIEKVKTSNIIDLPDDISHQEGDIYLVKEVGSGYVTEQGAIIPPEVKIGDKVIIKGKTLTINTGKEILLMARAQDAIAFERGD